MDMKNLAWIAALSLAVTACSKEEAPVAEVDEPAVVEEQAAEAEAPAAE